MKKNSTKVMGWYKLPVYITEDSRVEKLIDQEGMRGFGLYISILCRLYYKKSVRITQDQILAIHEKGCSVRTLKRVVNNYGLFHTDAYGHITSTIDYLAGGFPNINVHEESDATSNKATGKTSGKASDNTLDAASDNASDNASGNASDAASDATPDEVSTPAREPIIYNKIDKDKDKKNDYHHSKKKKMMMMMEEDEDIKKMRVVEDPISIIRQLPLNSQWTEMALMRCEPSLRNIILAHWEETKELFAQHVIATCNQKSILSEDDAKRYFLFYLQNKTTSAQLKQALTKQLREQQMALLEQLAHPGTYPPGQPMPQPGLEPTPSIHISTHNTNSHDIQR